MCVPNTAHTGVVPIPTAAGSGRQRYPDLLAIRGDVTLLVEVEPALLTSVAEHTVERFGEQVAALRDHEVWCTWREHVETIHSVTMPLRFTPRTVLVVCSPVSRVQRRHVATLEALGVEVCDATRDWAALG